MLAGDRKTSSVTSRPSDIPVASAISRATVVAASWNAGSGVPVIAVDGGHAGVEAVSTRTSPPRYWRRGWLPTCSCSRPTSTPYTGWGTPAQRAVRRATPAWLRAHAFAGGSMGPKVKAVCRFVEATGGRAAIGQLGAIPELLAGTAGTQVDGRSPDVEFRA